MTPQPGKPQDRQGIGGQLPPCRGRQVLDLDMRRSDRDESDDDAVGEGYVRDSEMMPKLILARELMEEAIQVVVARPKPSAVVVRPKRSDLNHATADAARASPCRARRP